MKWDEDHESPDVIDRRGEGGGGGGGGGFGGGGLFMMALWLLRTPYGWVVLVGAGIWFALTRFGVIGGDNSQPVHHDGHQAASGQHADKEVHFVSFVLDDVQSSWARDFQQRGQQYRHAKLVLFTNETRTGCGYGQAATGPFYCPQDERVYIDLGFYHELSERLGARGQFAQAYVIAHEIGHHIQKLTGTEAKVGGHPRSGESGSSVRLELQADCYAGIWAHTTEQRHILEAGDIDSALKAAQAIGDDRLQKMSTGTVSPEKWTHGSSAERQRWFKRGYQSGKLEDCDTFSATQL